MGNKMCKKKMDTVDGCAKNNREKKSSWKLERIINRFNLKPAGWKSESQLNQKQQQTPNKSEDEKQKTTGESIFYTKPILSKSTDWTDVNLEVPPANNDHDVTDHIHMINPKMNLIFDKETGTPTPPPRAKQHTTPKSNLKEKLEKIAKNSLQAIQGDKNNMKPVEEPIAVKKKINYKCPQCDSDEQHHNRDHHHYHPQQNKSKSKPNEAKRKKNLSVISLPNYNDLKLTVASSHNDSNNNNLNSSRLSLQSTNDSKNISRPSSTSKLDSYMNRCRSFGSFFPQQFRKFTKHPPNQSVDEKKDDVTSDDSFGPLEDWDLGLIEHYNPKDASLPRPSRKPQKPSNDKEMLSEIESLIVQQDEVADSNKKPIPPVRRSESLSKTQQQCARNSDVPQEKVTKTIAAPATIEMPLQQTQVRQPHSLTEKRKEVEDDNIEHSSLMRILQEFSIKDKQTNNMGPESLTPSLVEFERNLVEDFIQAEKTHTKGAFS